MKARARRRLARVTGPYYYLAVSCALGGNSRGDGLCAARFPWFFGPRGAVLALDPAL